MLLANTDVSCTMHNSTLSTFVQVIRLLSGYTGALFAFYSLVPSVLNWSGAAILNLSLLSSNLWAALARSIFLGQRQYPSSLHSIIRLEGWLIGELLR